MEKVGATDSPLATTLTMYDTCIYLFAAASLSAGSSDYK